MSTEFNQELDCTGLACPMPILKTNKTISGMEVGQVLKMVATDPGSVPDIDAWTTKTGHKLVSQEQDGDKFIFYIKKTK